jgi:hypothetical protein
VLSPFHGFGFFCFAYPQLHCGLNAVAAFAALERMEFVFCSGRLRDGSRSREAQRCEAASRRYRPLF